MIATSSKPLGGETTVIALDAALAITGRYPASICLRAARCAPSCWSASTGAKAIAKERVKASK